MGWFKQLCLSWIILSVAAVCVSCQQITSTLREGNRTCPGEEVTFTCTIRRSSTLPVLLLGWSSAEYIRQGGSLQLSTANMLGHIEKSTGMDGSITATATVTNNTNVNGERILESTLRITAVEASTVTCSGTSGDPASIEFTISAVPGIPLDINAREISRPVQSMCIILVQWAPPTNNDASDIGHYIVYVPSRNTEMTVSSSSSLTTLTVSNCGNDTRIYVAAVNLVGCVGTISSEVQPILLDIPIAPTDDGSATRTTTEGGSTPTSILLPLGAIIGISVGVVGGILLIACIILLLLLICIFITGKKTKSADESLELSAAAIHKRPQKDNFISAIVYDLHVLNGALADKWQRNIRIAARALNRKLNRNEYDDNCIKEALIDFFGQPENDDADDMKNALDALNILITDMDDNTLIFKDMIECLKTGAGKKDGYDHLLEQLEVAEPAITAKEFLRKLCEKLNEKERYKLQGVNNNLRESYGFRQSQLSIDKYSESDVSEAGDFQIGSLRGSFRRATQPTSLIQHERVEALNPGGHSPRLGASSDRNLVNGSFRRATQPTSLIQRERVEALNPGGHPPHLGASSDRNLVNDHGRARSPLLQIQECPSVESLTRVRDDEEDKPLPPVSEYDSAGVPSTGAFLLTQVTSRSGRASMDKELEKKEYELEQLKAKLQIKENNNMRCVTESDLPGEAYLKDFTGEDSPMDVTTGVQELPGEFPEAAAITVEDTF